ncbi:MAG: alpha/beta hydrolase-fold protein [Chitinophagaceae bacterium]
MRTNILILFFIVAGNIVFAQKEMEGFTMPSLAPVVQKDGTILFKLRAPAAKQVFIKLENTAIPMQKNKNGVWSASSGKMEPDIYTYTYIVDSFSIVDPSNPLMRSSYSGTGPSLITVPANPAEPWEIQNVPHGSVTKELFHSSIINDTRDFYVYTPPGYDPKSEKQYPVLYLLHGMGDDARGWFQTGMANIILDNLIAEAKAEPMILVSTLGYGVAGTVISPKSFDQFAKSLTDEVIPLVEKKYRASSKPSQRAIAGLSMGGAQSALAGLNHPELFEWIGAFSSAFMMYGISSFGSGAKISSLDSIYSKTFPALNDGINQQIKLLWFSCGKSDFLLGNNHDFMKWLSSKNIKFQSKEPPGAHTWNVWRRNLIEFAPILFK